MLIQIKNECIESKDIKHIAILQNTRIRPPTIFSVKKIQPVDGYTVNIFAIFNKHESRVIRIDFNQLNEANTFVHLLVPVINDFNYMSSIIDANTNELLDRYIALQEELKEVNNLIVNQSK